MIFTVKSLCISNICCNFAAAKVWRTTMTTLSHKEKDAIMKDMKSFDEYWDLGHGWSGDL